MRTTAGSIQMGKRRERAHLTGRMGRRTPATSRTTISPGSDAIAGRMAGSSRGSGPRT
jgi:hypothetical protein